MSPRAAYARRQMARTIKAQGMKAVLRRVTKTSGPDAAVNPPRVVGAEVNGNHTAGATSLSLRGAAIVGRFLLGDTVVVPGLYAVAAAGPVTAAPDHTVSIPLTEPLPLALEGGTAVSFLWACDTKLHVRLTRFPQQLVDGDKILVTDMRVRVAALSCPYPPAPQDQVIIELNEGSGPRVFNVIAAPPYAEDNVVIGYDIQGRA